MIETIGGLFVALIVVGIVFLWYFGVLSPVEISRDVRSFGGQKYVFYNRQCDYRESGKEWRKIAEIADKYFKLSQLAGIYYDPPEMVEDVRNCRASFGILVNQGEEKKIAGFLDDNTEFSEVSLPRVDTVSAVYPFRNFLSFFFAVKKVYPALHRYLQKQKIDIQSIMEIYDCNISKEIRFVAFHGKDAEQYVLTADSPPQYKKMQ